MIGAIIGTVAGVAGSLIGQHNAKKQMEKYNASLDATEKKNEDWYNARYNQDWTQTVEAQSMIQRARELAKEQTDRARGANAVMGGGESELAASKAAANDAIADVTAQIASNATAQKAAIESQYLAKQAQIDAARQQGYQAAAQQSAAAGGQALQAGVNLAGGDMNSYLYTGSGILENMFKSKKEDKDGNGN